MTVRASCSRPRPANPLAVAMALLLFFLTSVTTAAAAGTETIQGTIVEGTAGAPIPAGLVVTLQGVGQDHRVTANQKVTVSADGHFSFLDVPADPGVTYVVSTTYASVPYLTALPRATGQPTVPVQIKIFEPTTSDATIRVDNSSWLLGSVDIEKQQALILATLAVTNTGDRAYVGDHRGDPGSAMPGILPRALRIALPSGASDFQPQIGLDPSNLLPVENGYVDTAPILPGSHDFAYTFRIGYAEGVAELRTSVPYPTAKLRFLAPDVGLGFQTDRLSDEGTTQIEGHSYHVLGADNLKPDTTVTVDVVGLPTSPTSRLSPQAMQIGGIVVIALAVILALFLGLRSRSSRQADPLAERRARLVAIARLDDRFAAGQLSAERYQAERARQKRQMIDLILGGRAPASGPGAA